MCKGAVEERRAWSLVIMARGALCAGVLKQTVRGCVGVACACHSYRLAFGPEHSSSHHVFYLNQRGADGAPTADF